MNKGFYEISPHLRLGLTLKNLQTGESYFNLFPENLKKYRNLSATAEALIGLIDMSFSLEIEKLSFYKNLELLNNNVLDEIAWHWNVEFYSSELPKLKKIELIKSSYFFHLKKGTVGGLEKAVKAILADIKVVEWFEYGGVPFTFRLILDNKSIDTESLKRIYKVVDTYKNVRSTLDSFIVSKTESSNMRFVTGEYRHCYKITKFRG